MNLCLQKGNIESEESFQASGCLVFTMIIQRTGLFHSLPKWYTVNLATGAARTVQPGTTVMPDECRKSFLNVNGYPFLTVNHSRNLVNPVTKVHSTN